MPLSPTHLNRPKSAGVIGPGAPPDRAMEAGPIGQRTRMDAPKETSRARQPIGPERHIKKIPQNHEILFENKILQAFVHRVQVYMSKWLRSLTTNHEVKTMLTYKDLEEIIKNMSEEEKNNNVSVYVQGVDEFYSVTETKRDTSGILDDGHIYLVI